MGKSKAKNKKAEKEGEPGSSNKGKFGTAITVETAESRMPKFLNYYKEMKVVPDDEWDTFLAKLLSYPPMVIRFTPDRRRSINTFDMRKGTQSKHQVLLDHFKTELIPKLTANVIEERQVEIKPLSWVPNEMAWEVNISHMDAKKHGCMSHLEDFMIDGAIAGSTIRQDLHHFIPVLLLDVQPHHKLLDMCAFMNYHSMQMLEQLYSDPRKNPDGFLIASNNVMRHKQWISLSGSNFLSVVHDAKEFPDLYLSEEHTEENKVMYDRVVIDAPSSNDGNYRRLNRTMQWHPEKGLENHMEQKQILKRALEVLAVKGRVAYLTTALNPIENEAVVAEALRMAQGTVELMDVKHRLRGLTTRPGMDTWKVACANMTFFDSMEAAPDDFKEKHKDKQSVFPPSDEEVKTFHLDRCIRAMPQDNGSTAFFCAILTKKSPLPASWETTKLPVLPDRRTFKYEKYRKSVECVFSVGVTEMEWTTEVTGDNLKTTSTTTTETYPPPELTVTNKSLNPAYVDPKLTEGKYLTADDEDWLKLKSYYKFSNSLSPGMLYKKTNTKGMTAIYYIHPTLRTLKDVNKKLVNSRSLKNRGAKVFQSYEHELTPDFDLVVAGMGVMVMMPYLGKRMVNITSADLLLLLESKSLTFDGFTNPKTRKALEDMDPGCVVFHYKAEGKLAKPPCDIAVSGWRNQTFVKPRLRTWTGSENFNLRLLGAEIKERGIGRTMANMSAGLVEGDEPLSDEADSE